MLDKLISYECVRLGPPRGCPGQNDVYYGDINTAIGFIFFTAFVSFETPFKLGARAKVPPTLGKPQQWRNVISGGPRFKIFEAPSLVEMPKARVERRIRTSFLGVQGMLIRRFYRTLMVGKRHCDISEALAKVFSLQPEPGGPHLAHWGWGPPGSPCPSP